MMQITLKNPYICYLIFATCSDKKAKLGYLQRLTCCLEVWYYETYLSSKCSLIEAIDKCCKKLILQMYNVLSSLEADNNTRLTLGHGHKQRAGGITQPIRTVTVSLYVSQYLCSIHNRKHSSIYIWSSQSCTVQSAAGRL